MRVCAGALDEATRLLDNGALGIVVPHVDTAAQAKSELRSLLMSHLSLIDRPPAPHELRHAAAVLNGAEPAPAAAVAAAPAPAPASTPISERQTIVSDELKGEFDSNLPAPQAQPVLIRNGVTHTLVK